MITISPQSLFLFFMGSEGSEGVRQFGVYSIVR